MRHICYSSEVYHLDPRDLAVLADSPKSCKADCADKVVILIGEKDIYDAQKPVIYDTLLKGRSLVEKAVADGRDFIPVRIAFYLPNGGMGLCITAHPGAALQIQGLFQQYLSHQSF